jgi:hypothetical protein
LSENPCWLGLLRALEWTEVIPPRCPYFTSRRPGDRSEGLLQPKNLDWDGCSM